MRLHRLRSLLGQGRVSEDSGPLAGDRTIHEEPEQRAPHILVRSRSTRSTAVRPGARLCGDDCAARQRLDGVVLERLETQLDKLKHVDGDGGRCARARKCPRDVACRELKLAIEEEILEIAATHGRGPTGPAFPWGRSSRRPRDKRRGRHDESGTTARSGRGGKPRTKEIRQPHPQTPQRRSERCSTAALRVSDLSKLNEGRASDQSQELPRSFDRFTNRDRGFFER